MTWAPYTLYIQSMIPKQTNIDPDLDQNGQFMGIRYTFKWDGSVKIVFAPLWKRIHFKEKNPLFEKDKFALL